MQFQFNSSSALMRFDQRGILEKDKDQRIVGYAVEIIQIRFQILMSNIRCSQVFGTLSFWPKYSCKDFLFCSFLVSLHTKFKLLFTFKTLHKSTPGCTTALCTSSCSLQPASSPDCFLCLLNPLNILHLFCCATL